MYSCVFALWLFHWSNLVHALNTNLTLPWGTWQASSLPNNTNIYVFQNVRFGSVPPRFGNSSFPAPIPDNSTVQNSSYGPSCYQVNTTTLKNPPGGRLNRGSPITIPGPTLDQSEDCLFLDIYVPASALEPNAPKIPVIAWFFGGAYAFGSKVQFLPEWPFYSGQGIIEAVNNGLIFVASNYRLGAFGWLAGSYMEQNGLPNAGLWDQRLLLQWVQNWIGSVGGDTTAVSAWGESAGAGSILHHLIQAGGTRDPLFSKAMLQSPAFEWQWDRSGTLNQVYQSFSNLSGCGTAFNISCLRAANITTLVNANQQLFNTVHQTGIFPVGPSVDGIWMKTLPAIQFAQDAYWKGLTSIMVSHVANESGSFIPPYVVSNATFLQFLDDFMPESQLNEVKNAIVNQYDCTKDPYYGDYRFCVSMLIRDSTFTCNARQLYDAYMGKAYMMQYSFPAPFSTEALHATDLVPTFINSDTNITGLLEFLDPNITDPDRAASIMKDLQGRYKGYLGSYALYGDPNKANASTNPAWLFATGTGDEVQGVLEARYKLFALDHYFDIIADTITTQTSCDFWNEVATNISQISSSGVITGPELYAQMSEL